jgi:hypothetical protein
MGRPLHRFESHPKLLAIATQYKKNLWPRRGEDEWAGTPREPLSLALPPLSVIPTGALSEPQASRMGAVEGPPHFVVACSCSSFCPERSRRAESPYLPLLLSFGRERGASAPRRMPHERNGFSPGPSPAKDIFLKNPSKSACQAPRCQKILLTNIASTTYLRKILGIVVMLHLIK